MRGAGQQAFFAVAAAFVLALAAGVFHPHPAAALAPQLGAAHLSGFPEEKQPVRLWVNGQPLDFDALDALREAPAHMAVEVEIGGVRTEADFLGAGGFAAVYRFAHEGRDYVVKIPIQCDEAHSLVADEMDWLFQTLGARRWLTQQGYLRRAETRSGQVRFLWTAKGRDAVLNEDPEFYGGLAKRINFRDVSAGLPFPELGTLTPEQALHYCRIRFQRELQCCLAARREAQGSARAYPVPELQTSVPMPNSPSGEMLAPEAVVQQYHPAELTLESEPSSPFQPRLLPLSRETDPALFCAAARAAVAELERVHRLGLVHGDVKPPNMAVTAGGRVRYVDWGSSHTPAQLREGNVNPLTENFTSPARYRYVWGRDEKSFALYDWNLYNPFFDDYFGLAIALIRTESGEANFFNLFDADLAHLDRRGVHFRLMRAGFPGIEARIDYWIGVRRLPDAQALALAALELCGIETRDLPGYLVWGDPKRFYLSVDEIEREAAPGILGAAA